MLPDSLGGPTIVYDVIECKSNGNGTACAAPCPAGGPGGGLTPALPEVAAGVGAPMDPPWMGIARASNTSDE